MDNLTLSSTKKEVLEVIQKMSQEDLNRLLTTKATKAESNEELLQKGIIGTTLLSAAGKLNPRQAAKFAQFVFDLTGLTGRVRTYTFRNDQMDIEKIGVHKRVAVKFTESTDPGVRRQVSHEKVSLNPKKVMVPFEISDDYILTNLEGTTVEELIVKMMATQFGNDLEDLYINGDTTGRAVIQSDILEGGSTTGYVRDYYMGLFDGWLRIADGGTVYDALNSPNVKNVMAGGIKALDKKYKKRRSGLTWVTSPDLMVNLEQNLTELGTPLADQAFLGQIPNMTPYRIPALEAPLFEMRPTIVEEVTFTGAGSTVALRYPHVANVVVIVNTLDDITPTSAYVAGAGNDYTVDTTAGTLTHLVGGGIGNTETVLVTYTANPQLLLTYPSNLMLGIGQDVTVETDRNIYSQCNQWAMTAKVDVNAEEKKAIVKVIDIQDAFI